MRRNFDFSIGEFYHVYNRGVERRTIFMDKDDYERFVGLLYLANATNVLHSSDCQGRSLEERFKLQRESTLVDVGAWCLMPNHFHLLLKEKVVGGISTFMRKLLTGYSMYFNTKYHRTGILFQGRFLAKHLNTDEYLKYQYAYIHLNPIGIIDSGWKKKQLTDKNRAEIFLKEYKYSSYLEYVGGDRVEVDIINKSSFPEYFSSTFDFESMIGEWVNFSSDPIVKDGP